MSGEELVDAIEGLSEADLPGWVWGAPGISKSACLRQVAERKGIGFLDLRLTTMDPTDLRGLPFVEGARGSKSTDWARPSFLPSKGEGIAVLEEVAQAPPLMQAAAMELVLDRRVGPHEVAPGWRFFAASNRAEDRAGAGRVITPLLNRFVHLELEPSLPDWEEWALENGIDWRILSYLKYRPDQLLRFDPSSGARAWPTPRSWHMASRALAAKAGSDKGALVRGCIGEGAGTEFMSFLALYSKLPDLERIWADPKGAPVPSEESMLWALGGVLCEGIKGDVPVQRLEAVGEYVVRIENDEIAMSIGLDCSRANPAIKATRSHNRLAVKHAELLLGPRAPKR